MIIGKSYFPRLQPQTVITVQLYTPRTLQAEHLWIMGSDNETDPKKLTNPTKPQPQTGSPCSLHDIFELKEAFICRHSICPIDGRVQIAGHILVYYLAERIVNGHHVFGGHRSDGFAESGENGLVICLRSHATAVHGADGFDVCQGCFLERTSIHLEPPH